MLQQNSKSHHAGFTLVEIMIVVAIIALLAAIAVPNFLRARKRSQATRILEDLRILDSSLDQYAIDTGRTPGFTPAFADLQNYLKTGTLLYNNGTDLFGDTYGPFTVDSIPDVPTSAFNALSDVVDSSFWSPFIGN
jgi:prepilin-type N-terminal cleavage/methylation domain-containing protein